MNANAHPKVHPDAVQPLAVMCCGLGSAWPGMGRELYDAFPAARTAMDRIAAVADWDVLALMDETDIEKISRSRWQLPYLFLYEYAQWSQISSLGIEPSIMCGHSLGELIALCLAGVYSPEVAWVIMEGRARQMVNLEMEAAREIRAKTGMLSVHAGIDVIEDLRKTLPLLYVSNYNTPSQFILSGPHDILLDARRSLRKRRIPAIMLNVALAFHHPFMRMLRDPSVDGLNALEMHAPYLPVLSDVTTGFYPQDQPAICSYIADLDENSVRWTECVRAMWDRDGIRHFLELGPHDILCGLVDANEPRALCLASGRKGKETEQMQRVCAQLYELGHLKYPLKHSQAIQSQGTSDKVCTTETSAQGSEECSESLRDLLGMLARASGLPADELRLEMDLRYDLALRSSRFPGMIQEAEQRFGLTVKFEQLLGVTTVADLARALGVGGTTPERQMLLGSEEKTRADRARHGQALDAVLSQDSADYCCQGLTVQDFVEQPALSSLIFPDAHSAPVDAMQLRGACHFSHFADPALSGHGNVPYLPTCRALQAIVDGARLLFPSLTVRGIDVLRMYEPPLLPPGVTRECRLVVKGKPWLVLDRVKTRVCTAELYARGMTEDGRRTDRYTHTLGGDVWMTEAGSIPSPLCTVPDTGFDESEGEKSIDSLTNFYDTMGYHAPWRLLQAFTVLQGGRYQARMRCPEEVIAQNYNQCYTDSLYIFEGIMQAALLSLTVGSVEDVLSQWRLGVVRFVRFGEFVETSGIKRIQLQKTWGDEALLRFNAKAVDAHGNVLLMLHNLEFVRCTAAYPVCDADYL